MPFRHNSTGIDPENTRMLISDGWYTMKIREAEEMQSKKGYDMILCKCVPVNEPEYKDAEVWHYVVFLPKEQVGAGISVLFRKAIGAAFGGDDVVDAEEWIGKKFAAYITTETYEGKKRNKIQQVKALEEAPVQNGKAADAEVPF